MRISDWSSDVCSSDLTNRAVVVSVAMGWSDVGSWDALWTISKKDADGNSIKGDVVAIDSRNSLLRAERGPAIAAIGVSALVAISTRDAILIMTGERAQAWHAIVASLKGSETRRDGKG